MCNKSPVNICWVNELTNEWSPPFPQQLLSELWESLIPIPGMCHEQQSFLSKLQISLKSSRSSPPWPPSHKCILKQSSYPLSLEQNMYYLAWYTYLFIICPSQCIICYFLYTFPLKPYKYFAAFWVLYSLCHRQYCLRDNVVSPYLCLIEKHARTH